MKDLKEKTRTSRCVFKGSFLDVRKDEVILPDGRTGSREWVNHPGAICCIPVLENGKIGLIQQYRYSVRKHMIELPAGKLDIGEEPKDCAKRELEEEIGYKANNLRLLTVMYPAVGFANERMYLFMAKELKKTKLNLDQDEFIQFVPKKLEDAIQMIWDGHINDAKTIIGLLWAEKILR
tara:strand:+ start:192 stop:728 length:537 start_codon:yes stop_codon:yes gene_type:complete